MPRRYGSLEGARIEMTEEAKQMIEYILTTNSKAGPGYRREHATGFVGIGGLNGARRGHADARRPDEYAHSAGRGEAAKIWTRSPRCLRLQSASESRESSLGSGNGNLTESLRQGVVGCLYRPRLRRPDAVRLRHHPR